MKTRHLFFFRLFCFLIFFVSLKAIGQTIAWDNFVDRTFVFEINNKEALKLLKKEKNDELMMKMLHSPVAQFKDKWENKPEQGHFIFAKINKNRVYFKYMPVYPFQVFLYKEYGVFTLQVVDAEGNVRSDAKVKIGNARVPYDSNSKTYSIDDDSEKENRILTVELNKFRAIFDLEKHVVKPQYNYSNDDWNDRPSFYSYMITDKNKYKPHETVQFKSYALTGNKRPIKENLELWVHTGERYNSYKKIKNIEPYNPGGFADELILHDSLKLKLDRNYTMQLRDQRGRIVASTNFRYEDYELYSNKLEIKLTDKNQYYPQNNILEIAATDVNNLFLQNVQAEITVSRQSVLNSYVDVLFLPNTLLKKVVDLDGGAPTKFEIPPDIFKQSNCSYAVSVVVHTIDNQRMEQYAQATYYSASKQINYEVTNDTIHFSYYNLGVAQEIDATLSYNNSAETKKIRLPHSEKINTKLWSYKIATSEPKTERTILTSSIPSQLNLAGGLQDGAFDVKLVNPLKLDVSWYVYQGNQLIEKGSGSEFEFKQKYADETSIYYVEMFYLLGESEYAFRRSFVPEKDKLNIDIDLPERIYPGQKLDATIKVKNNQGKPVSKVDLTAFAVNSLLDYYVPDLPYYGDTPKSRERRSSYEIDEKDFDYSMQLNYDYWNKFAVLDTLPYYNFTYPNHLKKSEIPNLFLHKVNTPDGSTQFAPYIMQNGAAQKIYVIEKNDVPVYFSWAEQPQGYSFIAADTVKQKFTLRLYDRAVVLYAQFERGKKTILSFDLDKLPPSVYQQSIKYYDNVTKQLTFTPDEKQRYRRYIACFPVGYDQNYLEVNGKLYPIYHHLFRKIHLNNILAGPLPQGKARYSGGVEYRHEGGFRYVFEDNVVYKYDYDVCPVNLKSLQTHDFGNLNDFYLTRELLQKAIERERKVMWHPKSIQNNCYSTQMRFDLPAEKDSTGVYNLFFEDTKTGELSVFSKHSRDCIYGNYNAILLYNNGKYLKKDSLPFVQNSYLQVNLTLDDLHENDTLSARCFGLMPVEKEHIQGSYQIFTPSRNNNWTNKIDGYVRDTNGEPLIGASVYVKGTTQGCVTDIDGYFALSLDEHEATIVVRYIGFKNQEIAVRHGMRVDVRLEEDSMMLEEAVVVGYGVMSKQAFTGSSASIGVAAGISVSRSESDMQAPADDEEDTSAAEAKQAEEKLYAELLQLNGLRTNFSDVGFWQPRLVTDKKGESKFTVTFPDNITKWNTVVYAMNRKLQTGTARKSINSYKPIMAELKTPQFLVVGDTSYFATTIRNYTSSAQIQGATMFSVDGDTLAQNQISLQGGHTDKFKVHATSTDSIISRYIFTRDDGYNDGEERRILVIPQGTEVADGTLGFLRNGDEISISSENNEDVYLQITGKQLDICLDAASYLSGYKYACNEQLASKLIGLLTYKKYVEFKREKFEHDKNVDEIIARLLKNKNQQNLWSWWGNSPASSNWMSAHIMRALKMAQDAGYGVDLQYAANPDYSLTYAYKKLSIYDIELVCRQQELNAASDYSHVLQALQNEVHKLEMREDSIVAARKKKKETYYPISYLKEKLLLWEMQQKMNVGNVSDSIAPYLKKDIYGRTYCDDDKTQYRYSWRNDKLTNTLTAYRIIRNDSILSDLKEAMQMYIIAQKVHQWNTYQASSVVVTIFDDLLATSDSIGLPASINLSGSVNQTIKDFPYKTKISDGEKINISKKSGTPLIYSTYKIKRVTEKFTGDAFEINTYISNDTLTAGVPVTLHVTLDVKQEGAEYVMVEVPIPASCSYASKYRDYFGVEVHREHFKEKTVIFCEKLPIGRYKFRIELMPRYTGKYILNPAKAELMYTPVIHSNNDLRVVGVSER